MGQAWERLGRLLAERTALVGGLQGESDGVLLPGELDRLAGRPERQGPTREEVAAAYEPLIADARKDLLAELEQDTVLGRIARYAGLAEPDATVLALAAAAELDEAVGQLLGGPLTVGMLRSMLSDDAVTAVGDDAPLRRAALVRVVGGGPLGGSTVQLARRVAWALVGDLSFDPDLPADLEVSVAAADRAAGGERVLVSGPDRVRRVQAATDRTAGVAFLVAVPPPDERGWEALVAQATVVGAGLVLDLPPRSEERAEPIGPLARRWIDRAGHLPIAVCAAEPVALESLPRQRWTEVVAAGPEVDAAEWSAVFGDAELPARRPSASQLRSLELVADADTDPVRALRRLASGSLLQHARRVEPRATWSDLVLPPPQERQLRALVDRYRHRARVHDEWHLPLYPSPGVVALFSGHSGTGKTTSAEVIAHELGVDLFRVDLSALVSKYIGETEKNLEQIFSAAHAGNYLLLFDEADSLFGSRSAVTDARDRYANMEVSYLLQRLETYDGFVVLTSNFQGNIDDAFLRRIHTTVSFPMPSPDDRVRIWERCLADAPRGDVDLDHLARSFEISGGSIRNAALSAAFLAAGRDRPIGMVELLAAVVEEYAKLRQRVSPAQLGPWATEVSELVGGLTGGASGATTG
ncbi:ATP-binding protein [Nocardioides sp. LMS-CY]|uniref:ATP-binding protein n=1 Tax=Nocardioides sp. (strain LMS-CY) TaxID=2840457 RepID=UPI001BFFF75F|nr:ATP-binding protein [Nocardioides sp. LMS-CY]QWF21799.1 ATP-binding protein [Nocardioides sp. LMS-CY]